MGGLLEHAGFVVGAAEDAWLAVILTTTNSHQLVLTDIAMANAGGSETTQRIVALPDRECLPIVALTAHAFDANRARCLSTGMNDRLAKPPNPNTLWGKRCARLDR